jgi:type VI secretion system secreted protein Hcp
MESMFLKFKDIKGDSDVSGHKEEIEILSFSHGASIPVTGDVSNSQRTSGRPNLQDLTVTKFVDQATPTLYQRCCEGKMLGDVTLTVTSNEDGKVVDFLIYTLKDVVISSVSVGGGGSGKPVENLSLNYSHITWKVVVQKHTGGKQGEAVGKWDVAKNTPT